MKAAGSATEVSIDTGLCWRDHVLATWWLRTGAYLVDGVIVIGLGSLARVALGLPIVGVRHHAMGSLFLGLGIGVAITIIYMATMMWKTNGLTVGKHFCHIRVVRSDEKPMTFTTAVIREVLCKQLLFGVAILDVLTRVQSSVVVSLINYLWPLWDRQNRALHDYAAATRVVRDD
jgi:uncharacterized RDD family membrane protein YckC